MEEPAEMDAVMLLTIEAEEFMEMDITLIFQKKETIEVTEVIPLATVVPVIPETIIQEEMGAQAALGTTG